MLTVQPTIDDIFAAYAEILKHPITPTYMQITLGHLREIVKDPARSFESTVEFLNRVKDVPDEAIVVLRQEGNFSLLTNDEGHLLAFA